MYRIVASDMDGTFLTEEHVLPQANIDAVLRMRELGVLFVPASGRPMPSILYTIRDLPPEALEGSYVLSYNGGVVHKVGNPEPLYANTLPFEVVDRIFQWGLTQDVGFHVYETGGKVWGHLAWRRRKLTTSLAPWSGSPSVATASSFFATCPSPRFS